nr:hypothetical protein GCM10017611_12410 [Rhodococcus wratislaviensis]
MRLTCNADKGILVNDETALLKNRIRSAVPDSIPYGGSRTSRTEASATPPSGRAFIDRGLYLREPRPEDRNAAVQPDAGDGACLTILLGL